MCWSSVIEKRKELLCASRPLIIASVRLSQNKSDSEKCYNDFLKTSPELGFGLILHLFDRVSEVNMISNRIMVETQRS